MSTGSSQEKREGRKVRVTVRAPWGDAGCEDRGRARSPGMRTPPGAREERQEMHSPPGPLGGASPEDNDFSPERLLWTLTCRPVRRANLHCSQRW